MATVSWSGINEVVAALHALNTRIDAANERSVVEVGAEVERIAKNNFEGSHRRNEPRVPNSSNKPNIVTGNLRRGIRGTPISRLAGGWTTTVGPTAVYGRRVELGFVGTDSIGRHYNQPAYPYFGPAVREVRVKVPRISATNWAAALRG